MLFEDSERFKRKPDLAIRSTLNGQRNTIIIANAGEKGYKVTFDQNLEGMWILVMDRTQIPNLKRDTVEIDEDYLVSEGLLCDEATTWLAVQCFLKTGAMCPAVDWVRDFDLPEGATF